MPNVRVLVDVLDRLPIYSKDRIRTKCMNAIIVGVINEHLDFAPLKIMSSSDVHSHVDINSRHRPKLP
jgi:hypothetical protein